MSDRDAQIFDQGIRAGLEYAAGFLDGAAVAAGITGLSAFAKAFTSAAGDLRTITPEQIRAEIKR